jgi:sugar-phosphatase
MTQPLLRAGLAGRTFAGVIFDMDQTLVDSMAVIDRSWTAWAMRYEVPAERFEGLHGVHAARIVERLLPPDLWDEATRWIVDVESGDFEVVHPMPGAMDALTALPPERVAVATSATEGVMRGRLRAAGFPVLPSVLVHQGLVRHGKPAPDIFLKAAELLGIDPADALVVEDAPVGIAAARAAGMASLGILSTTPAVNLPADAVATSLADAEWSVSADGISVAVSSDVGEHTVLVEP